MNEPELFENRAALWPYSPSHCVFAAVSLLTCVVSKLAASVRQTVHLFFTQPHLFCDGPGRRQLHSERSRNRHTAGKRIYLHDWSVFTEPPCCVSDETPPAAATTWLSYEIISTIPEEVRVILPTMICTSNVR